MEVVDVSPGEMDIPFADDVQILYIVQYYHHAVFLAVQYQVQCKISLA